MNWKHHKSKVQLFLNDTYTALQQINERSFTMELFALITTVIGAAAVAARLCLLPVLDLSLEEFEGLSRR